jgi:hypothetical protein
VDKGNVRNRPDGGTLKERVTQRKEAHENLGEVSMEKEPLFTFTTWSYPYDTSS